MAKTIPVCRVADYVAIKDLKLHPNNPREISRERLNDLKQSMIDKGVYQPILVWKDHDGIVLAGNHRLLGALELIDEGYQFTNGKHINRFPVVFEDVTKEKALAILLDSNNTYATWVEEKLRDALKSVKSKNLQQFGFAPEYLDKLMADAIKDAEEFLDKKEILAVDTDKLMEAMDEEKQCTLVITKVVYDRLLEVVAPIARRLEPRWKESDDISEALDEMIDSYWGLQPHKKKPKVSPTKLCKVDSDDFIEDVILDEL